MGTGDRGEHLLEVFAWGRCLSKRSRRALAARIEWADVPHGAPVMTKDAAPRWVTFVVEGELEIVDGHSSTRVLRPGDAAGAMEALHNTAFLTTAIAGPRGAKVGLLERRAFVGALQTIPEFAAAMLRSLTAPVEHQPVAAHRRRLALRWAA